MNDGNIDGMNDGMIDGMTDGMTDTNIIKEMNKLDIEWLNLNWICTCVTNNL